MRLTAADRGGKSQGAFMPADVNQKWLEHCNAETLYHLERQGRTGPGLVPFLGAGISTAFGLKDWKGLLLGAAPPHLVDKIESLLDSGQYEEAAEKLLNALGADGFQNMVAASAGDSNIESFDFQVGMVSLLPLLASGPIVTTKLDFWDLAAHIPDVLPAVVQEKLLANRLLFLGHGLAAADVESLVRFAHKHHPGARSYAVVFKEDGIEYWRQCGVEILHQPVNLYVIELAARLAKHVPPGVVARAASTRPRRSRPPRGRRKP